MPIPDSVIERVVELASSENMPSIQNQSPIFEWSSGVPIDEEDLTYEKHRGANIDDKKIKAIAL